MKKCSAHIHVGLKSLVDDPRSGQTNTVIKADLIDNVDDLVRCDYHVILRMLVTKVNVSVRTVWTIIHNKLRYRKVCAHWVPMQLTDLQKELSMGIALQHLFRYYEDSTYLKRQHVRCCTPSFSKSKVHYLLNSSSTEELFPPLSTVRHSKTYAGPPSAKDWSCSRRL